MGISSCLVRKKTGDLRICVDYRPLNLRMWKDAYPYSRIDEALEALRGTKYVSTAQGYNAMRNERRGHSEAGFPGRPFKFTRIPFGLCNAPTTYQRLLESMLSDFNYRNLLIYYPMRVVLKK